MFLGFGLDKVAVVRVLSAQISLVLVVAVTLPPGRRNFACRALSALLRVHMDDRGTEHQVGCVTPVTHLRKVDSPFVQITHLLNLIFDFSNTSPF